MSQAPTWEDQVKAAKRKPAPAIEPEEPRPAEPLLLRRQVELLEQMARSLKTINRRLLAFELVIVVWFIVSVVSALNSLAERSPRPPVAEATGP